MGSDLELGRHGRGLVPTGGVGRLGPRLAAFGAIAALILSAADATATADDATESPAEAAAPSPRERELEERLRRMEELNAALVEQMRALAEKVDRLDRSATTNAVRDLDRDLTPSRSNLADLGRLPRPTPPPVDPSGSASGSGQADPSDGDDGPSGKGGSNGDSDSRSKSDSDSDSDKKFKVGYDGAFYIRPEDKEAIPFELRFNGRIQARYEHFEANERQWFDQTGDRLPILSRNQFSIPRARLDFRGFAFDPKLQYRFTINGTTNNGNQLTFLYYWVNYEFSKSFNLHFGRNFIPGSRYWSQGSSRLQFAGRSLATTFFQPGRSVGIWATGEPADGLFYWLSITNAFRGNSNPDQIDRNFVFSGTGWWDLWDNYGQGYSDLEWHDDFALRIGNSLTFTHDDGERGNRGPLNEEDEIRLSDGTQLDKTGALAPGVTVDRFDLYLYAIDAALKYRGFSLNGEYYMRWLQGITGDGPLPRTNLFDHGFVAQGGYFLIPERLELIARTSQIFGYAGTAEEYAGGLNWFFTGSHNFKLTVDATKVIGSPTNAQSPNYVIGDNGVLFRTQIQVAY